METTAPVTADAFKLSLEGGDVVLEFGQLAPGEPGHTAVAVSDRVILPLQAARRLLPWLEEALKPHQAALRAAEAKTLAPAAAAEAARPGPAAQRAPADQSGEHAAQLLRLVGAWGVPHVYERSFRVSGRGVQANRFLLTVNRRDIPEAAAQRTLAVCDRMGMPPALRGGAEAAFGMANCVHFGFEGDAGSIVCKLYLERAVPAEEAQAAAAGGEAVLLHLAFKWDLLGGTAVTTRYLWRPGLNEAQIAARMAAIYGAGQPVSLAIAQAVLGLAAEREPAERLQFLEVAEEGTARRSFDLNLYNAKLQVRDIQHLLQRMREHFGLRPGQFQALYDQIKGMTLGHLAGGVHREGQDFFNVYYGAVGLPRFAADLR